MDEDAFETALEALVAKAVANEVPVEGYWFLEGETVDFEIEIVSVRQDTAETPEVT